MPITHSKSVYGPDVWVHLFSHKGKSYRLFKRKQTKNAPWAFKLTKRGQLYKRSLETSNTATATQRAKTMIDEAEGSRWDVFLTATNQRPKNTLRIKEFLEHYHSAPATLENSTDTTNQNTRALWQILRSQPKTLTEDSPLSEAFTLETITHYKREIITETTDIEPTLAQRRRRSANSILRKARSLFSKQHLDHYSLNIPGWTLTPGIQAFMDTPGFRKVTKDDYNPPPDNILTRALADLETMEEIDPNAATAVWLSIGFGLRKAEVASVRGNWFTQRDGRCYLRSSYLTKNNKSIDIPCQNNAWPHLQKAIARLENPDDHLLTGSPTERKEKTFRRISTWMREIGWDTQKTFHEWRAWAGCQVILQSDLLTGSMWLRHSSVAITQAAYGRYLQLKDIEQPLQAQA